MLPKYFLGWTEKITKYNKKYSKPLYFILKCQETGYLRSIIIHINKILFIQEIFAIIH